jgi:hypothetical protein
MADRAGYDYPETRYTVLRYAGVLLELSRLHSISRFNTASTEVYKADRSHLGKLCPPSGGSAPRQIHERQRICCPLYAIFNQLVPISACIFAEILRGI